MTFDRPDRPDRLRDVLAGRGAGPPRWEGPQMPPSPTAPTGLPAPPPNPSPTLPPAWQRYKTGLEMQNAISNNWSPNPTLIRILRGQ